MQLSDLLDELREGILHDVSNQIAGVSDQLWTDKRLIRYINEAQYRFARLSFCIRDNTTPDCCQFLLRTGVEQYELHPSILAVISARIDGDQADLARAGHSALDAHRNPDPYFFDPSSVGTLPPGKPLAFSTDEALVVDDDGEPNAIKLKMYPIPSATYNARIVRLRVVRLPLNDLTPANLAAHPEIPRAHHMDMLDWAAYLALRKVDVDAGLMDRAQVFKKTFEDNAKLAKRDLEQKIFQPMQWGFGRNGFSWER
jgi:hypothetical protein